MTSKKSPDRSPFTHTGHTQHVFRVVVEVGCSVETMLVASERYDRAADWAVAHWLFMCGDSVPMPDVRLRSVENLGGLFQ